MKGLTRKQMSKLHWGLRYKGKSYNEAFAETGRAKFLSKKYGDKKMYPGKMSSYNDYDGDGKVNKYDCFPFDKKRQDDDEPTYVGEYKGDPFESVDYLDNDVFEDEVDKDVEWLMRGSNQTRQEFKESIDKMEADGKISEKGADRFRRAADNPQKTISNERLKFKNRRYADILLSKSPEDIALENKTLRKETVNNIKDNLETAENVRAVMGEQNYQKWLKKIGDKQETKKSPVYAVIDSGEQRLGIGSVKKFDNRYQAKKFLDKQINKRHKRLQNNTPYYDDWDSTTNNDPSIVLITKDKKKAKKIAKSAFDIVYGSSGKELQYGKPR